MPRDRSHGADGTCRSSTDLGSRLRHHSGIDASLRRCAADRLLEDDEVDIPASIARPAQSFLSLVNARSGLGLNLRLGQAGDFGPPMVGQGAGDCAARFPPVHPSMRHPQRSLSKNPHRSPDGALWWRVLLPRLRKCMKTTHLAWSSYHHALPPAPGEIGFVPSRDRRLGSKLASFRHAIVVSGRNWLRSVTRLRSGSKLASFRHAVGFGPSFAIGFVPSRKRLAGSLDWLRSGSGVASFARWGGGSLAVGSWMASSGRFGPLGRARGTIAFHSPAFHIFADFGHELSHFFPWRTAVGTCPRFGIVNPQTGTGPKTVVR